MGWIALRLLGGENTTFNKIIGADFMIRPVVIDPVLDGKT